MLKITKPRIAAGAATAALMAGGIGTLAATAGASSASCQSANLPSGGGCGDEVSASGYGLAVLDGTAQSGKPIIASSLVDTSTSTDFYAHITSANSDQREFEYAPGGKLSNLCITQSSANGTLTLSTCNSSSLSQWFYGLGSTGDDAGNTNGGVEWMNAQYGMVMAVGSSASPKVTMVGLSAGAVNMSTYLNWDGQ